MMALRLVAGFSLLFASAFEFRSSLLTSQLTNLGTSVTSGPAVAEPLLPRFRPSFVPAQIGDFRVVRDFGLTSSNEKPQDALNDFAKGDEFAPEASLTATASRFGFDQARTDGNLSHALGVSSFSPDLGGGGSGGSNSAGLVARGPASSAALSSGLLKNGIVADSVSKVTHRPDGAASEENQSPTPEPLVEGQKQHVPDGGTSIALLGMGVAGIAFLRRNLG